MREYLNIKEAAKYCCYNAAYFGRVMETYKIPKYGPKKNRIKITDLDAWMKNPEIFIHVYNNLRNCFRRID